MSIIGQLIPLGLMTTGSTHRDPAPESRLSGGQMSACMGERYGKKQKKKKKAACVSEWSRYGTTGDPQIINQRPLKSLYMEDSGKKHEIENNNWRKKR